MPQGVGCTVRSKAQAGTPKQPPPAGPGGSAKRGGGGFLLLASRCLLRLNSLESHPDFFVANP